MSFEKVGFSMWDGYGKEVLWLWQSGLQWGLKSQTMLGETDFPLWKENFNFLFHVSF